MYIVLMIVMNFQQEQCTSFTTILESKTEEINLSEPIPSDSTDVCIFCLTQTKRIGKNRQTLSVCMTDKLLNNVKLYANGLEDFTVLEKLNNCSAFVYHPICRFQYQKKYEKTLEILTEETSWHKTREVPTQRGI